MRIVVVSDHAHINGGQAKVAIVGAVGLAERGHRVDYFAAVGPIDPTLEAAGVTVTLLGQDDVQSTGSLARFGVQWLWNDRARRALADLLATCDPADTIVHVHGWSKALSPAIGRALVETKVPVVHTLHDYYLVCPNGGFYDYHAARNCGLNPMSVACIAHDCDSRGYHRKLMRVGRHALMHYASGLYPSARHVVTLSKLQREVVAPWLRADAVCYEIANPIDGEAVGPREADAPIAPFLFVGRLSPEKGPRFFAEAAQKIGAPAVFVGDGPSAEELRRDFPQAQFVGWRSPQDVRKMMRQARALVFPSVWYEGQPLTVYEALSQGAPVIVSDLCAGREAVRDGETGCWFKSGDVDSLASAMSRLQDDSVARKMSQAAYDAYWRAPLTIERHLDETMDVYRRVMAA